jgi:phage tail sheath protein FI
MPEYLAPGVYVEEVSFRAKSIEGVSTSVTGFVGPTRYGPVGGEPELLTSFADFERIYGGLDSLDFESGGGPETQLNFMAHAARAFFDNGGSKLYVTRVYEALNTSDEDSGKASLPAGDDSPPTVTLRARFPGRAGNMRITLAVKTSPNLLTDVGGTAQARGLREHDVVFITNGPPLSPSLEDFYDVVRSGDELVFDNEAAGVVRLSDLTPASDFRIHLVTFSVRVLRPGQFDLEEQLGDFSPHPLSRNALTSYFTRDPGSRRRFLSVPFEIETSLTSGRALVDALLSSAVRDALLRNLATDDELAASSPDLERPRPSELDQVYTLAGGDDGRLPTALSYRGSETGIQKTGLETFADVEEISIVAAPGHSFKAETLNDDDNSRRAAQIVQNLITHVERMRYRVAVLDAPNDQVVSEVRNFRGQFDSKYAALYYPWVRVLDPLDRDGLREIHLPPSGFVTGIYARNDVEKGVHKAPANEVVRGAINIEFLLNKSQQDVLNPEGVNCFRFFEGRGFRLWGARTVSSDPEWKYISVRRYFVFLEHSIDKGTQWAVFENNNETLWANIRQTVSDFLFNEWKNGALLGAKPEEAFFVRCDRTTMTQNDMDNGRLICLIGVAVVKPAEFIIFRIGQWTADRKV